VKERREEEEEEGGGRAPEISNVIVTSIIGIITSQSLSYLVLSQLPLGAMEDVAK